MEDEKKDENEINPFGSSKGLEWVDDLVRSGFGQTTPSHSSEHESRGSDYPKKKTHAVTVCLADVQPESIKWLWPGHIALGKLTLISGDPGLGKSLVTAYLAAVVSKGYPWPLDNSRSEIGSVVLLSAEDDAADTIRPRLDAAEADCTHIHIVQAVRGVDEGGNQTQRLFSLKSDITVLEELLPTIPDCRLLVIDPISAYLGDKTDSHKNSEVRGLLAPLSEFAARYGIAIILIDHLNKNAAGNAMYRSMGSIAFVAAARAAYVVTKDRDNPERRLVMPIKNNLAKDSTGLAYSVIEADNGAPVIVWETEPITITADEALAPANSDEDRTDTDWAINVLRDALSKGPVKAADVQREAKQVGISQKALRRAREKLAIKPKKIGFKEGWVWSLPGYEDAHINEDAPPENEGILDTEEHLRNSEEDREPEILP